MLNSILFGSFYSTILITLLITLRKLLVKYIGATWNYYLWFTIFALWLPLHFSSLDKVAIKLQTLTKTANISIPSMPQSAMFSTKMILIIWLTGTIISLTYVFSRHWYFLLQIKQDLRPLSDDERNQLNPYMKDNHNALPRIYLSKSLPSPLLCHLFKTTIYLPSNFFAIYSPTEQHYVLQHEYTHYRRHDLFANTAMLILACVNWFNPSIFYAYRHFRIAQELACDASVSRHYSSAEKKAYGYCLLKTVINQNNPLATMGCRWNSGKQLKERCEMLTFHQSTATKTIFGTIILIVTACASFAAPTLQEAITSSNATNISFSANNIQAISSGNGIVLAGNVKLQVGNVTISADKILVKYTGNDIHKATEYDIMGEGLFEQDNHTLRLKNAVFDPKTKQLSAEQITRLK